MQEVDVLTVDYVRDIARFAALQVNCILTFKGAIFEHLLHDNDVVC